MNFREATRHFLARFTKQENAVNPDQDQAEETQDAADSPPAEETINDVPQDPPVEDPPVPATPIAPSIDDQIVSGSANIQAALSNYRSSRTAEHDARMALVAAQAEVQAADGAEEAALTEATEAITVQIRNLQALREALLA